MATTITSVKDLLELITDKALSLSPEFLREFLTAMVAFVQTWHPMTPPVAEMTEQSLPEPVVDTLPTEETPSPEPSEPLVELNSLPVGSPATVEATVSADLDIDLPALLVETEELLQSGMSCIPKMIGMVKHLYGWLKIPSVRANEDTCRQVKACLTAINRRIDDLNDQQLVEVLKHFQQARSRALIAATARETSPTQKLRETSLYYKQTLRTYQKLQMNHLQRALERCGQSNQTLENQLVQIQAMITQLEREVPTEAPTPTKTTDQKRRERSLRDQAFRLRVRGHNPQPPKIGQKKQQRA